MTSNHTKYEKRWVGSTQPVKALYLIEIEPALTSNAGEANDFFT